MCWAYLPYILCLFGLGVYGDYLVVAGGEEEEGVGGLEQAEYVGGGFLEVQQFGDQVQVEGLGRSLGDVGGMGRHMFRWG